MLRNDNLFVKSGLRQSEEGNVNLHGDLISVAINKGLLLQPRVINVYNKDRAR